ncbi:neutral zinc metallopeptidase [Actinoplanes sp. CA-051413]|uniref:neutral zinc metallopeptidase n=1 Tax=Actinoplanes sp. CA-051413 TaxID=3239899 RepID=UPI003D955381
MSVQRLVRGLLAGVLVAAASGCVVVSSGGTEPRRPVPPGGLGRMNNASANAVPGDVVTGALRDVERFWSAAYPRVAGGAAFTPIKGGYHPYTRSDPAPACGGQAAAYQPNAFYCPAGDFVAWDAETLIPQLYSDFGPLLVGFVMAHEYGHAIQSRLGVTEQPTVVLEQQADCFAGAWTADVLAGRSTAFKSVTPAQLDNTVAGMLLLRDEPGTAAQNPQAHGNAFDRIRAMQDGVEKGVSLCADYRADNVPVTEVPFTTQEEAATGGDLPYAQAVDALSKDAQAYWARAYPQLTGQPWETLGVQAFESGSAPSCPAPDSSAGGAAFYCPDGDFIAFDDEQLGQQLYQRIGDNAVGMLLGDLFARAVQDRRGAQTQDRAGQLAVDCFAGAWTNDLLTRDPAAGIRLSPGDLDEAVAALLAFGRAGSQQEASAFDRIGAYRGGVLKGLPSCS